jgi:hypothetical protein
VGSTVLTGMYTIPDFEPDKIPLRIAESNEAQLKIWFTTLIIKNNLRYNPTKQDMTGYLRVNFIDITQ